MPRYLRVTHLHPFFVVMDHITLNCESGDTSPPCPIFVHRNEEKENEYSEGRLKSYDINEIKISIRF